MQKFYKYFTLTIISFSIIWLTSALISGGAVKSVAAQTENETELCSKQKIFVLSNTANNIQHMVYNFESSTVSLVRYKADGFGTQTFTVESKSLGK